MRGVNPQVRYLWNITRRVIVGPCRRSSWTGIAASAAVTNGSLGTSPGSRRCAPGASRPIGTDPGKKRAPDQVKYSRQDRSHSLVFIRRGPARIRTGNRPCVPDRLLDPLSYGAMLGRWPGGGSPRAPLSLLSSTHPFLGTVRPRTAGSRTCHRGGRDSILRADRLPVQACFRYGRGVASPSVPARPKPYGSRVTRWVIVAACDLGKRLSVGREFCGNRPSGPLRPSTGLWTGCGKEFFALSPLIPLSPAHQGFLVQREGFLCRSA